MELLAGKSGTKLGGLRPSLAKDFSDEITIVELQVLGILAKHLTGPWMKKFYNNADSDIDHDDGIHLLSFVLMRNVRKISVTLEITVFF